MKYVNRFKLLFCLKARPRLGIASAVFGLAYIASRLMLRPVSSLLIAWNLGVICFLGLTLSMMHKASLAKICLRAKRQYEERWIILTFVISAAISGLLAIFYILGDTKNLLGPLKVLHIILSVFTVLSSWLLIHTMFALQYANVYYHQKEGSDHLALPWTKSLDFPEDCYPDYWDFLYFSFVLGMTCQVADIQVRSRKMRRLTLVHGVLSFFFNTFILALSINIVAGLI